MSSRTSTTVLGMELAGPIILAAGPLSDSLDLIERALAAGAGALVTKTIYSGNRRRREERISRQKYGAFNSTTYSHKPLYDWFSDLEALATRGHPIIASVHAETPDLLQKLVRDVTDCGVQAIELGISCPVGRPNRSSAIEDMIRQNVASARSSTDVALSVKLTAGDLIVQQAQIAIEAGADAITLSDTLPAVVVDVQRRRIDFGGPVGYSGAAIRPLVLHSIYQIRKSGISCPILGVGGVESLTDVLEYIFVGCVAVQIMTAAINRGVGILGVLQMELEDWCEENQTNISEMVGAAVLEGVVDNGS